MLVLSRRLSQSIMIGDDIRITVLGNHRHTVRIGIDAPEDTEVHRDEVYQKIQANKKAKRDTLVNKFISAFTEVTV